MQKELNLKILMETLLMDYKKKSLNFKLRLFLSLKKDILARKKISQLKCQSLGNYLTLKVNN